MQNHGGISGEELARLGREIIDFSVSVNPGAPHPYSTHIVNIDKYPSRTSEMFCQIVSSFYNIDSATVLPLGGATEGIYLLPHFYKKPAGIFPIYGDYLDAFSRDGVDVIEYRSLPEYCDADLFLIVNPQNPTGEYFSPHTIREFAHRNPHTTVIIDEAYQEMGYQCESCIGSEMPKNIVVLRSLTKATGWPSLRAGFFVGDKQLIEQLKGRTLPWQITSLQLELIAFFYNSYAQFEETWSNFDDLRDQLVKEIQALSLTVLDGRAPFITFIAQSNTLLQRVLFKEYGILIRDCRSFGLKDHYRIMPQGAEDNRTLLNALKECL